MVSADETFRSRSILSLRLVKYNQITQGLVNQGQCARDVALYTPEGELTSLFSQLVPNQPLVVVAGSTS